MKAWGKKKPEIQNTGGMPCLIQPWMKSILSTRSSTHAARGFREGYACVEPMYSQAYIFTHIRMEHAQTCAGYKKQQYLQVTQKSE